MEKRDWVPKTRLMTVPPMVLLVRSRALDLTSKTMGGTVISLVFGTQSLFSIGIPVLSGMVADLFGLQRVFWLLAGLILVSNLIAFFLKDSRN